IEDGGKARVAPDESKGQAVVREPGFESGEVRTERPVFEPFEIIEPAIPAPDDALLLLHCVGGAPGSPDREPDGIACAGDLAESPQDNSEPKSTFFGLV